MARFTSASRRTLPGIWILIGALVLALAGCGGSDSPATNTQYPIAGKITGLSAAGLILRNNGGDDLVVPANATSFQFATQAVYGSGYSVSILAQPNGLTCTVNRGTGSNVTAAVSGIDIPAVRSRTRSEARSSG
jgi:hypothetical protein